MAEQGYITVRPGVAVNDAIREVNSEGWQVKQVVAVYINGADIKYGLLLER